MLKNVLTLLWHLPDIRKHMDAKLKDFILAHAGDDCGKLLLGSAKWPDIDMRTAVNIIESRRKLKYKLPQWYACKELIYPNTLSAEQCSGEAACRYKLEIISGAGNDNMPAGIQSNAGISGSGENGQCREIRLDGLAIADLTGGLGADSANFASAGAKVLYNEMDKAIYASAIHNFPLLGVDVLCRNMELRPDNVKEVLDGFCPDIAFLDPARRSGSGGKVFRLEDCLPDLTKLLGPLFREIPRIIVKLSPMADVTLVCRQIETAAGFPCVHSVHISGSQGECKELVMDLRRNPDQDLSDGHKQEPVITVAVEGRSGRAGLTFLQSEEKAAGVTLCGNPTELENAMLFEPGSVLMKAAPFRLLCSFGMKKAGISTHLYFTDNNRKLEIAGLGKIFKVIEVLPLDKRGIKSAGLKYPRAEVTARNIPMDSGTLRKRLGVKSGDSLHIFGIRCDFLNSPSANFLIVTRRLK